MTETMRSQTLVTINGAPFNGGAKILDPNALSQLLRRLSGILARENDALARRKPQELRDTAEEKSSLVALYNQQMGLLKNNPRAYAGADPQQIEELKEESREFHKLLDEHFRMLSTVRNVTEGLVRTISEEVAKKERPIAGYTANASMARMQAAAAPASKRAAIAVNQVV